MNEIFIVMVNNSEDGRGPSIPKVATSSQSEAKTIADKLEPYGHPGQFNYVTVLPYVEKAADYDKYQDKKDKDAALRKLTAREQKLLGLA